MKVSNIRFNVLSTYVRIGFDRNTNILKLQFKWLKYTNIETLVIRSFESALIINYKSTL